MDIKLNYREQGDGYPLILLHGNGEDSSCFRHQLEYFSKELRVIAIDTRGQGESPRGTALLPSSSLLKTWKISWTSMVFSVRTSWAFRWRHHRAYLCTHAS